MIAKLMNYQSMTYQSYPIPVPSGNDWHSYWTWPSRNSGCLPSYKVVDLSSSLCFIKPEGISIRWSQYYPLFNTILTTMKHIMIYYEPLFTMKNTIKSYKPEANSWETRAAVGPAINRTWIQEGFARWKHWTGTWLVGAPASHGEDHQPTNGTLL